MLRILAFLILLFLPCSGLGQQGNYKYNQYGNRSILLTGNVTGSVSDIGLTYYNPSKLTEIEINGFAFNARAYQYNSIKVDPIITNGDPLSTSSFTGVPSLAGGTFSLFDERFAYVFLAKYRLNNDVSTSYDELNQSILDNFPLAEDLALSTSITNNIKEDWYGMSWAKKFDNGLSLGLSVFGVNYKYRGRRAADKTFRYEPERVTTDLVEYNFDQRSYGVTLKIGASYTINNVDLGLNATLPYMEIFDSGSYKLKIITSGTPNGSDRFYDYIFDDIDSQRRVPFGISAGAGIHLKKSKIHVNIDYRAKLNQYERLAIPDLDLGGDTPTQMIFDERRRSIFNVGIGGEIFVTEKFKAFFGFSTDFDSLQDEKKFFDFTTTNADDLSAGSNYYHFSSGVDWTLKWANIILGLTYSRGASNIDVNFTNISTEPLVRSTESSQIISRRVQLVLGFEIPFLDSGVEKIRHIQR